MLDQLFHLGHREVGALGQFLVDDADARNLEQRPRLAPHREAMTANLARVLQVAPDRVAVKFTTTDQLGTIGRGEGIAAWATCLVRAR